MMAILIAIPLFRARIAQMPRLSTEWKEELREILDTPKTRQLYSRVLKEYETQTIFPPKEKVFAAFDLVAPKDVRVVILGQDPYHTPQAANGLAFSMGETAAKMPPSLSNIIKEVQSCFGKCSVANGDLTSWAKQGVLLLNTCLTVRNGQALSHKDIGWEDFTSAVVSHLSKRGNIIFVLWGSHARKYKEVISTQDNLILESAHPSPLSAHNGFFGCRHFQRINEWLDEKGEQTIDF